VVRANLAAASEPAAAGRVMNIAVGHAFTLNELVRSLGELLDLDVEPEYAEARPGDVRESLADISNRCRAAGLPSGESNGMPKTS